MDNLTFYDITQKSVNKVLSGDCKDQFNAFFSAQPEELVKQYCGVVSHRLLWVLFFVGLMWLVEPKLRLFLEGKGEDLFLQVDVIMFLYKWLGLGLLFIVGYGLFML